MIKPYVSLQNIDVIKRGKTILKKLDLDIYPHDKIVISGQSGSGKSTLLRSLLLFEQFTHGTIHWQEKVIDQKNIQLYRKQYAFISQNIPLFEGSLNEYLKFPFLFKANRHHTPSADKIYHCLKTYLMDPDLLQQPFQLLSTGERQRASIIQALLLNKSILLFDEITSNLDPNNVDRVIETVLNERERTIVAVTHDPRWHQTGVQLYRLENGALHLQ